MKIKNQQLKEFILDSDLVPAEALEGAYAEAEQKKTLLGPVLLEKNSSRKPICRNFTRISLAFRLLTSQRR